MTTVVTIRLPDEVGERLERLAQQTNRTKAFYVREALTEQLQDIEDAYLAAELSRRVSTGALGFDSWDDLRREFDADGEPDMTLLEHVR